MKLRIAKYRDVTTNYTFIHEVPKENSWPNESSEYMRLTEYLEIELIEISDIEARLRAKQVSALDTEIENLFEKIENLRAKKAELLSLTYQEDKNAKD